MNEDLKLKQLVEEELEFEPRLNAAGVGVAVNGAVVTLSGHVDSYSAAHAAQEAALRVAGVCGVVRNLEIRLTESHQRTDEDIARAAGNVLAWSTLIPTNRIKIVVANGWITLEGTVDWHYQRKAAEELVRDLVGVRGLTNELRIEPQNTIQHIVEGKIIGALKRSAEVDARGIKVAAEGDKIVLSGRVSSWNEREDAERAAWSAPGVRKVECRLVVRAHNAVAV
jgi:osmotically-inducible protein OsmY